MSKTPHKMVGCHCTASGCDRVEHWLRKNPDKPADKENRRRILRTYKCGRHMDIQEYVQQVSAVTGT